MISVDTFFVFLDYYFLLCCCYMWPSARCGKDISPFLCANMIWKSFLKYEWCQWNCKLQFHGHHSYFRKAFQMLLTLKEGFKYIASTACTRSHIATTKQKIIISNIRKNCPLKSSYVAPHDVEQLTPCVLFIWASLWENLLFAYAKTETQTSCAVTAQLISAFVSAIRIAQSLYYLNPKFQGSGHLRRLYSPVCVGPGRKQQRPFFSQRGSYHIFWTTLWKTFFFLFCEV